MDPLLSNLIVLATMCDNSVCVTTAAQRKLLSVQVRDDLSEALHPPGVIDTGISRCLRWLLSRTADPRSLLVSTMDIITLKGPMR